MVRKSAFFLLNMFFSIVIMAPVFADRVRLKDGTTIDGKITTKKKNKYLTILENGSERTITWKQINHIEEGLTTEGSRGRVLVTLKDGSVVEGLKKNERPGRFIVLDVQGEERVINWANISGVSEQEMPVEDPKSKNEKSGGKNYVIVSGGYGLSSYKKDSSVNGLSTSTDGFAFGGDYYHFYSASKSSKNAIGLSGFYVPFYAINQTVGSQKIETSLSLAPILLTYTSLIKDLGGLSAGVGYAPGIASAKLNGSSVASSSSSGLFTLMVSYLWFIDLTDSIALQITVLRLYIYPDAPKGSTETGLMVQGFAGGGLGFRW